MARTAAPSKGAWIDAAGKQQWSAAGQRYEQSADHVEPAATYAADTHIVQPMAATIAAEHPEYGDVGGALVVWTEQDQHYVGLPDDHELSQRGVDLEYGTEEQPPGAPLRKTWWDNQAAANTTFQSYLWSGEAPE